MRTLVLFIAVLMVVPAFGQRSKKTEDAAGAGIVKSTDEGLVYSLPRTGIRVYVKAARTDFTPGPYARFAEQLLGIANVAADPSSSWVITEMELATFSEPDPGQVFKTKGLVSSLIALTPDGCLAGINSDNSAIPDEGVVTNLASVPGKIKGYQFTNLSDASFFSVGDSINRFRGSRLSADQKAAQVASRILDCRKMKYELAAGLLDELPPDGLGYEATFKQFDTLEKDYLALFTGVNSTSDFIFSFEYIPSSNDSKGDVVFRFSEQQGLLDKSDVSGKPVMIELTKVSDLSGNYDRLKNSDNPLAGTSGVYYRLPGMAEVKLIQELKVVAMARFPIAQFGAVAPVPENLLDGSYSLEFHTATGAIKKIRKIQ